MLGILNCDVYATFVYRINNEFILRCVLCHSVWVVDLVVIQSQQQVNTIFTRQNFKEEGRTVIAHGLLLSKFDDVRLHLQDFRPQQCK